MAKKLKEENGSSGFNLVRNYLASSKGRLTGDGRTFIPNIVTSNRWNSE